MPGRLSSKGADGKNASDTLVAMVVENTCDQFAIKIIAHPSQVRCCVSHARNDGKTVGRVAVIVGAFLVCWLPFFVTYLASPFVPVVLPDLLVSSLNWLGWTNSAINPVIYTLYSAYFRQAFSRLIMFQKRSKYSSNTLKQIDNEASCSRF